MDIVLPADAFPVTGYGDPTRHITAHGENHLLRGTGGVAGAEDCSVPSVAAATKRAPKVPTVLVMMIRIATNLPLWQSGHSAASGSRGGNCWRLWRRSMPALAGCQCPKERALKLLRASP